MGNLTQIIELHETKGVEAVLEEQRLWENLEQLQQELNALAPEKKEELETKFQKLLEDLAANQEQVIGEMKESAERLDSAKKNTEACLSYTEASSRHKPGRRKG